MGDSKLCSFLGNPMSKDFEESKLISYCHDICLSLSNLSVKAFTKWNNTDYFLVLSLMSWLAVPWTPSQLCPMDVKQYHLGNQASFRILCYIILSPHSEQLVYWFVNSPYVHYPHKLCCLIMRIKQMIILQQYVLKMKNKILPTCLEGNYRDSLGEFSNTSWCVWSWEG